MKPELEKFVMGTRNTILEAMTRINTNYREVVFVVDGEENLIGSITDGDIRRGLLGGKTFQTGIGEIMNASVITVPPGTDRATVLDLMKARGIRQVPVVENRKILEIHFIRDLIGATNRPNVAVIMAGGKGTRLRPLTEDIPKPMVKVAGRPILERLILHLVGSGVRKIYLSVNYLGEMIESYFGQGEGFGCSIRYLKEEKELHTGGSLSLLPETPQHPLLVMNGDLVTQFHLGKLLEFHHHGNYSATLCVKPYPVTLPFGVVQEEDGRLLDMVEKPSYNYLVNAGIYVINPEVLPLIPTDTAFPITDLFQLLLNREKKAGVFILEEDWIDVGRYDELRKANGA
jgi:dTDP-glucose pyrophosphorylase